MASLGAPLPAPATMRRWKPHIGLGLWVAIVLLLAMLAGGTYIAREIAQALSGPPEAWPINLDLYWRGLALLACVVAIGALIYRIGAALTLSYDLDRNGLYITWLGNRAVVPLDQIFTVEPSVHAQRLPLGPLQMVGYRWGRTRTADGLPVHLFSTRSLSKSLAIHTRNAIYAISPADLDGFVQDLEQRRNLGATKSLAPMVEAGRVFLYDFWNDRIVRWLLLLAVVLNVVVIGLLMARYPQLGAAVEMRFNATGAATELRPRHHVLFLPLAAFGLTLLNIAVGLLLYRPQRLGARLLQGASVVVQVLFAIAILSIILR